MALEPGLLNVEQVHGAVGSSSVVGTRHGGGVGSRGVAVLVMLVAEVLRWWWSW